MKIKLTHVEEEKLNLTQFLTKSKRGKDKITYDFYGFNLN